MIALHSLYDLVNGECPSLLEDDHHDEIVTKAIQMAEKEIEISTCGLDEVMR